MVGSRSNGLPAHVRPVAGYLGLTAVDIAVGSVLYSEGAILVGLAMIAVGALLFGSVGHSLVAGDEVEVQTNEARS